MDEMARSPIPVHILVGFRFQRLMRKVIVDIEIHAVIMENEIGYGCEVRYSREVDSYEA